MQPGSTYPNPTPPQNPSYIKAPISTEKAQPTPLAVSKSDQPVAVVQALSVRGVEYTMMSLCLWFGAAALIWALLSLVNGGTNFEVLALPVAILIVSFPVFAVLFIRLRKGELANPELRLDPSKRRLSQFTQIFAFAAVFFNLIAVVYEIMQKAGGRFHGSVGKLALNFLIVLVVAGGILAYYWFDEHRLMQK